MQRRRELYNRELYNNYTIVSWKDRENTQNTQYGITEINNNINLKIESSAKKNAFSDMSLLFGSLEMLENGCCHPTNRKEFCILFYFFNMIRDLDPLHSAYNLKWSWGR